MSDNSTLILYLIIIFSSCLLASFSLMIENKSEAIQFVYGVTRKHALSELFSFIVAMLPMILLVGLRYNTGADYWQYTWNFDYAINNPSKLLNTLHEPVYYIIQVLVYFVFGKNTVALFTTFSALTLVVLAISFHHADQTVKYPLFIILYGFFAYLNCMNYVRQMLAASFVVAGIVALGKKRKLVFVLMMLLATGCHLSSIIFLLLPVFVKIGKSGAQSVYHWIMLLSFLWIRIIIFVITHVPFLSRYAAYFTGKPVSYGMGWIIDVIPILLLVLLIDNSNFGEYKEISWLIIPLRIFGYYGYGAGRLFITIGVLMISLFCICSTPTREECNIYSYSGKTVRLRGIPQYAIEFIIVVLFFTYFIFTFYYSNSSDVFPYTSVFMKR